MTVPDIVGYPPQLQATANVLSIIGEAPGDTLTASGTQVVTVSQTGTGAIHVTGNATGGVEVGGATDTSVTIGTLDTNKVGFCGATPIVPQSTGAVTTVAELLVLLINTGLFTS